MAIPRKIFQRRLAAWLVGYAFCDAFHTPRALGPLRDIALRWQFSRRPILNLTNSREVAVATVFNRRGSGPLSTVVNDAKLEPLHSSTVMSWSSNAKWVA
jgi:hypothetical protein